MLKLDPVRQLVMRVLIVEDDKALADGLIRTLRQSGYAVDHAETGELALRACAEEHYDLVVLDLGLPGIDGFDVLRQLRRGSRAGSILILTADTVGRRASIGSDPLDLTPREWAALEYLLMRVGQVVSKEHMLQAMCSWDDSLTHNAIEVYISRLRSKLHDAGIRIRTVRGFGYMVEDPDAV